jgi:hypothetical protein
VAVLIAPSGIAAAEPWPWDNAVAGVPGPLCEGALNGKETLAANGAWHNSYTMKMTCSAVDPSTGQKLPWAFGVFRPDGSLYLGVLLPATTGQWDHTFENLRPAGTWTMVACAQSATGTWGCPEPRWTLPIRQTATPAPAPRVTSTAPSAGATSVSRSAALRVRFNRSIVRPTTKNVRLVDLDTNKAVAVRVTLSSTTVVVTPRTKLVARHHYRLTLSGLKGTNGTPAATVSLAFTTGR